ncbi:MAG: site-specific integrase [Candidatus Obscuribacterales bacterium]|nr:site-specific integrase [Candidatus Obscuribacterales bacterium]
MSKPPKLGEMRNGIWHRYPNVYIVATTIDGKRHQRSFGNDYEAAVLYMDRLNQERRLKKLRGENPVLDQIAHSKSGISVKEVLLNYCRTREQFLKQGTIESYKYLLNRLAPLWKVEAESLSVAEISKFISSLKSAGLSNKTIRELIMLCRSAFNMAIDHDLIAAHRNAFAKIKAPVIEKHEPQPFSEEEIEAIFEELNPRLRLMFWVQFSTGLRTGELIALRFGDVDFQRNRINVQRTRRHGLENAPKTKSSLRQVFMPPDVRAALLELKTVRKAKKDDYLFLTQYGLPYADVPVEAWKDAVERAGVEYRRCYTLRHSFASHALSNNVRLSYVSEALGHSSVNVTAQKYIRHIPDANSEDESKLAKLSKKSGTKLSSSCRGFAAVAKKKA